MTIRYESVAVRDFAALGREWRDLEARAASLSFFQSWTWVGCLAAERYPDAVLLRAVAGGRTLGLALFNRRRGRLCLAESGDPALDAPFIEHNAPLLAAEAGSEVLAGLLRTAWTMPGVRRLRLGGVPAMVAAAAGGQALRRQERVAPCVDLVALRHAGGDFLAGLSANTRHQLRRSARRYGGPTLARATTLAEARDWLAALVALHERSWQARGQPGAFATPWLRRFHDALLAEGVPRGEVELLRVAAGDGTAIGYLYNFRLRGRVSAYQSGFDLAGAGPHGKPGLTCHQLAVERALAAGDTVYDFLAGADRYKCSLANGATSLWWVEAVRPWSPLGPAARLRQALRPGQGRRPYPSKSAA